MTIAHKLPLRLRDESFLAGCVGCITEPAREKHPTLPGLAPFVI
jgi:hypothetical protein